MDFQKYRGIFPAFYACYENTGEVSPVAVRKLARHLKKCGVQGLYVGGSSGECIYQSVDERKTILEQVMEEVGGEITVIAHVACNNTEDSQKLARHAEEVGADAIAAIPPIYFKLPPSAIANYWNSISDAAPHTDFIIYNIPQLVGVSLSVDLLREMKKNPRLVGVKNSSLSVLDIMDFRKEGVLVFNGPDEQLVSGLAAGAIGGIGGTYGIMPELYLKIAEEVSLGRIRDALEIQDRCCDVIALAASARGNLYGVLKEVLRISFEIDCGSVRPPLEQISEEDKQIALKCTKIIENARNRYCR